MKPIPIGVEAAREASEFGETGKADINVEKMLPLDGGDFGASTWWDESCCQGADKRGGQSSSHPEVNQ